MKQSGFAAFLEILREVYFRGFEGLFLSNNYTKENFMNFTIQMQSFTEAQKARSFLMKRGFRCFVERNVNKGRGCGFALRFPNSRAEKAEVCALLREIGVSCGLS